MTAPLKQLLLINPRIPNIILHVGQRIVGGNPIPGALLTLCALTPRDYEIKIVNQRLFWRTGDFVSGCLVGITCLTNQVTQSYLLADKFRRAGSKVVLGGPHVSALPEEALEHADSVVVGEAESVWAAVIRDYENDELNKVYTGEPLGDFFSPVFDFFLNLHPRILAQSGIHIDRGCKYQCDFCARISKWLRVVPVEHVLSLVRRVADAHRSRNRKKTAARPIIMFVCDNIYSNPEYAKELFRKLIPLGISWTAGCSIDFGFDDEAMKLAQASGCQGILVGIESIHSRDFAKTSLKQIHSQEDYLRAIRNIKAHRIRVVGSFILGLDSYYHRDYLRLLWFIIRAGLWHVLLAVLTPFPGSALYTRLQEENRIISRDWRKYNMLTCVIRPRHTSVIGLYFWYIVIRYLSVFVSSLYGRVIIVFLVSYELVGWLMRHVIYRL